MVKHKLSSRRRSYRRLCWPQLTRRARPRTRPCARSSKIPETYVEPVFVQATPAVSVQALSAPKLSAQTFLAQTTSAQTAPVRAAPVPAVQAQVFSAPHYAEPTRVTAPAPAVAAADAEAWKRLRAILDQNLGNRSPRVYKLMHTELGAFSGAELISRLASQVERIAGATAARNFRNGR